MPKSRLTTSHHKLWNVDTTQNELVPPARWPEWLQPSPADLCCKVLAQEEKASSAVLSAIFRMSPAASMAPPSQTCLEARVAWCAGGQALCTLLALLALLLPDEPSPGVEAWPATCCLLHSTRNKHCCFEETPLLFFGVKTTEDQRHITPELLVSSLGLVIKQQGKEGDTTPDKVPSVATTTTTTITTTRAATGQGITDSSAGGVREQQWHHHQCLWRQ
ncbi:hypothetical protein O3P69_016825 [Scylla paramamosain]|uniref:Uncharacterized protein n=1 Tax=Scylla paramamosain TaxID=85552 RepID=A0AAW0SZA3_SCYPA